MRMAQMRFTVDRGACVGAEYGSQESGERIQICLGVQYESSSDRQLISSARSMSQLSEVITASIITESHAIFSTFKQFTQVLMGRRCSVAIRRYRTDDTCSNRAPHITARIVSRI